MPIIAITHKGFRAPIMHVSCVDQEATLESLRKADVQNIYHYYTIKVGSVESALTLVKESNK